MRPALDVADVFRAHGPAYRLDQAGHLSLGQLKAMSAIETCRTADLGGHVERCEDCAHLRIAYNSCRNRHCPKCQGAAAREWMAARATTIFLAGRMPTRSTAGRTPTGSGVVTAAACCTGATRRCSPCDLALAAECVHVLPARACAHASARTQRPQTLL